MLRLVFLIPVFVVLFIVGCNLWVVLSTRSYVYHSITRIPKNKVALVLGTSKYSRNGNPNLFFKYRMVASGRLYTQGKAEHFIASGDNSYSYYNEPQDMKKALIAQGIPADKITLDYAGFRTFDSMVRSKKIFGQDSLTIITQGFHCYRALFIARFYNIQAIALASGGVPEGHSSLALYREYLARCKAVIDLYLLHKKPRFLGEPIIIEARKQKST